MPMSIAQAAGRSDASGHPLPTAWPSLAARGVEIRGGELTVIAGQPAAGKSAFALDGAMRMKVPTLYFCADTAAWTMSLRVVAMASGLTQDQSERAMSSSVESVAGALEAASHIKWCFDSAPTLDDIDDEISAYEEVHGRNPQLIVIDNLVDVSDGDDEWAAIRRTQKELKWMARETGSAVVVLHHVTEAHGVDSGTAPGRSSILGKDTRLPALVLTIGNDGGGYLNVSVVKNRYGLCDPSGRECVYFGFDGSRMRIWEPS